MVEATTQELTDLVIHVRETLNIEDPFDADTPLLTAGYVDSFGVVVLLSSFEERYGVEIDESDVSYETFDTPRQMLEHIRREGRPA